MPAELNPRRIDVSNPEAFGKSVVDRLISIAEKNNKSFSEDKFLVFTLLEPKIPGEIRDFFRILMVKDPKGQLGVIELDIHKTDFTGEEPVSNPYGIKAKYVIGADDALYSFGSCFEFNNNGKAIKKETVTNMSKDPKNNVFNDIRKGLTKANFTPSESDSRDVPLNTDDIDTVQNLLDGAESGRLRIS